MNKSKNLPEPASHCLKDKCILVTGAYGGLGTALSLAIGRFGGTVILAGRNIKALEKLYDELEANGAPTPAIFPIDLEGANQQDYYELAGTLDKEFGRLDGLVHCAASLGIPMQLEHYPVADWVTVMQVNVTSAFLLTRSMLPLMDKTQSASIVFTTDKRESAYWGAYGVSKSALSTMASIMADEIEGKVDADGSPRIAVNTINPGPMRTKLRLKSFAGELPSESPLPDVKTNGYINVLSRSDPALHGELINL